MQQNSIRVLIVDDHELVRQAWRMLLHNQDSISIIKECASGIEAIHEASASDPHVILMDINMTPVNGFEATRKILQNAPHIKIIGISVNNQPSYARNMMQLGARGYVTKNSSREEMIKAIHDVMNGKIYVCKEVKKRMSELK
ncbi:MAG TPA: response regulator transcription factor [Flavisolibacter sp.]|jgi:DNA-binding NarL/FixJ family response regulator|nr:response regulator transcription factor [Flavisolibacter sp.]